MMDLETPVEYFYGDTLRWSFGFENPNKAAVVFVCALPLLWWLWQMAWRIGNRWLRLPALLVSSGLLMGAWYCLIMTFSRGGLVAAALALAYGIAWGIRRCRKPGMWWKNAQAMLTVLLIAALIGGTVWNGLGGRSADALGKDASVGNRVELWGSALQMAVENPRGFGTGKSGEQYLQWYQPTERQEGYRTMVNSYLTFLVEQGWLWFGLSLSGFAIFWAWTKPGAEERLAVALRASILGFLVAGTFSTTMEETRLWIFPAACAVLLTGLAAWKKKPLERTSLLASGGWLLAGCVSLVVAGLAKSGNDPLRREFGEEAGFRTVTAFGPKNPQARSLGCIVDESVLGDRYAKLLRELALHAGVKVMLGDKVKDAESVLCVGQGVHSCGNHPSQRLLLLAPEKIEESELKALLEAGGPVQIILPEIDEDGRVGFWEDILAGGQAPHFSKTVLTGVGNRADWAWEQVVEVVKNG
jgi:O-antigen ligase